MSQFRPTFLSLATLREVTDMPILGMLAGEFSAIDGETKAKAKKAKGHGKGSTK